VLDSSPTCKPFTRTWLFTMRRMSCPCEWSSFSITLARSITLWRSSAVWRFASSTCFERAEDDFASDTIHSACFHASAFPSRKARIGTATKIRISTTRTGTGIVTSPSALDRVQQGRHPAIESNDALAGVSGARRPSRRFQLPPARPRM
jgi:hypothetical protein